MKKLIKIILIALILFSGYYLLQGYQYAKATLSNHPIEEVVKEQRANKDYVTLDMVNKDFVNAVVSVEDRYFYQHNGINIVSMAKALFLNVSNKEIVTGGSTISQQLVKNIFLTQDQTFERKIAEIFITLKLENIYTKDEILELYINNNYYGDGFYGIKQASIGYFHKSPSSLDLAHSSLLAGLPNAPSVYQLSSGFDLAKKRQRIVLDKMIENKCLTKEEADKVFNERII
ncbi:MAG: biosynthetic peptidoglycan transglycosylase, partial [Erysipelotrichaceae bacterium]